MCGGMKGYSQTDKTSQERRSACGSLVPQTDEQRSPHECPDQHKPAVTPLKTAVIVKGGRPSDEPRAQTS